MKKIAALLCLEHISFSAVKKLFLCVAVLFTTLTTFAQTQRTHFGLKAGVNLAHVNYKSPPNGTNIIRFHTGALAQIELSGKFALQGEIVYSMQGTKQHVAGEHYEDRFSYVNVPLLAQYNVGKGFRIETGPQLGFLIRATTTLSGVDDPDRTKFFEPFIVEWGAGASYLSAFGIGVNARYNFSLMNIDGKDGIRRHRVLQFGLFYHLK